jgi:hypothetical protein
LAEGKNAAPKKAMKATTDVALNSFKALLLSDTNLFDPNLLLPDFGFA